MLSGLTVYSVMGHSFAWDTVYHGWATWCPGTPPCPSYAAYEMPGARTVMDATTGPDDDASTAGYTMLVM